MIHHERDVREEQKYMCVARTNNSRVISIVACCHSAKLWAHAARDFRSQQSGAVTRMWRSCGVQPSHEECAIGVLLCKKEGILSQRLRWCCVDCMIHHELDVREEQKYMYVARTSNNRVISSGDLYCCLLPQCEALRTCRSGFPIARIVLLIENSAIAVYRKCTINSILKKATFLLYRNACWCSSNGFLTYYNLVLCFAINDYGWVYWYRYSTVEILHITYSYCSNSIGYIQGNWKKLSDLINVSFLIFHFNKKSTVWHVLWMWFIV